MAQPNASVSTDFQIKPCLAQARKTNLVRYIFDITMALPFNPCIY